MSGIEMLREHESLKKKKKQLLNELHQVESRMKELRINIGTFPVFLNNPGKEFLLTTEQSDYIIFLPDDTETTEVSIREIDKVEKGGTRVI